MNTLQDIINKSYTCLVTSSRITNISLKLEYRRLSEELHYLAFKEARATRTPVSLLVPELIKVSLDDIYDQHPELTPNRRAA